MDLIKCPRCGTEIEIDKALAGQIESRIMIELNEKHQRDIERVKRAAEQAANDEFAAKLKDEAEARAREAARALERAKEKLVREAEVDRQNQADQAERLREEAAEAGRQNKRLREEMTALIKALRETERQREEAALEAERKLTREAQKIREEAKRAADEAHRLKELELQKQLSDTKRALDEATRKADQGSEQIQGEVLELALESLLRAQFPTDVVEEVKKGVRGADVRQYVRSARLEECGLIVWESKNAKWNAGWIQKLKDDLRAANASIGVIVSNELPDQYRDMCCVDGNVWVVKPRLIVPLAEALRQGIIQVYAANRNAQNKDGKMEVLYQFLTGVEFRNRIEAIVDNYNTLLREMEKEKRAAELRWGKQEKAIRAVIGNTYGLYGDLQGITGSELSIPLLEAGDEEE